MARSYQRGRLSPRTRARNVRRSNAYRQRRLAAARARRRAGPSNVYTLDVRGLQQRRLQRWRQFRHSQARRLRNPNYRSLVAKYKQLPREIQSLIKAYAGVVN